jgi:hypothetical protein
MSAVWDSGKYDGGALLVLLAMADYADEQHECWPSVAGLARKARLSERQVSRILRQLRIDGAITPTGKHRTLRGSPIVVYRINFDLFKGDMMTPLKGDKMSPFDAQRVTFDAQRVTPTSYDPSYDPPSDQRDDKDIQNGGSEGGNELPAAVIDAWRWPLTAQARAFLRNAIAGYSEEETLRAIEIAASQPKVERPAAYIKRVLQSRMSALADAAPMAMPAPMPTTASTIPRDEMLVRSAIVEALPSLADSADAWPIRIDQDAVTVAAGHRAQWLARISQRLTHTVATYLQRPITLTITEAL